MAGPLPPKPFALRAFNAAGAALAAVGVRVPSLAPERLLAAATRRTGLSDFGDPSFRTALDRLVAAFEREAALTTLGRALARRDLLRLLEGRLRMEATLRANPDIEATPVRAPIFVLGLPRTGTTILHELLALDPASRVPLSWEVMTPWPPPERATFETDPRIAVTEKQFSGVEQIIPGFQAIHRMGASLPQECVAITAYEFASILFTTTHRIPDYQTWLESIDHRALYRAHRRWLQYFQWRVPAARWVLKSPGHLWTLDALLAVYPDARIVQTHRDPLRVLASLVSLSTVLRSMASDALDPHEIAREWAPRLAAGLEASIRARDAAALPPERVFDLHFHEFLGSEIETIRRLYGQLGLELSSEAETRMRRYLAANPKDKHGGHRYDFGTAGLDPAAERRRFAAYVERFAIPEEAI
jgi:Sulfotransferase family